MLLYGQSLPRKVTISVKKWYQSHTTFAHLIVLYLFFRLFSALFLLPGNSVLPLFEAIPDLEYWLDVGRLSASGLYPYIDYWMEYPPLYPWLVVGLYKLTLLIPAWGDGVFWFHHLLFAFNVPFDVGALWLIYRIIAVVRDQRAAIRIATVYALLFGPIFALVTWFDSVAVFFLLLALDGIAHHKLIRTGLGIGIGFNIKLFPLAVFPAAIRKFNNVADIAKLAGIVALTIITAFVPFYIISPSYTLAFFKNISGRVPWQTIWALLTGYYGPGMTTPLGMRTDLSSIDWMPPNIPVDTLPWNLITLIFAAIGLYLYTRRIDWQSPQRAIAFAGLTFGMMMLYGKGFSAQFNLYLIVLALVILPELHGIVYGLLFSILMVMVWPLSFWVFESSQAFIATWIIISTVTILSFTIECGLQCLPERPSFPRLRRLVLLTTSATVLLGLILWIIPGYTHYKTQRLTGEPLATFIAARQSDTDNASLFLTSPLLMERINPYLPDASLHVIPNYRGQAIDDVDTWLVQSTMESETVWLLHDSGVETWGVFGDEMRLWFDENTCLIAEEWHGAVWARHYTTSSPLQGRIRDVAFTNGVTATYPESTEIDRTSLCVAINWHTAEPVKEDYAAFVHIISPDGTLLAQNDRWLSPPSSTWQANSVYTVKYGVTLPDALTPGKYTISAGLYNSVSGERLLTVDGQDHFHITDFVINAN